MELEGYDYYSGEEDVPVDSEDEVINFSGDDGAVGPGTSHRDCEMVGKCQTLTPDMISKKMFEIIKEVNEVFQVRGVLAL